MNFIFPLMMAAAIISGIVRGNAAEVINAGFAGAEAAVKTTLSIAGIMCLWTGLLQVGTDGGAVRVITKIISPLVRLFFPRVPRESDAFKYISLNMTANLLGIGNAATPAGLKAAAALDEMSKGSGASRELCRFILINTASLQLVPSTVIALRAAAGSANPSAVTVPVWIVSAAALTAGLLAAFRLGE